NNDFVNLLSSVQMAMVMLGPDLRIRRFTPAAEKLFNLLPGDIGRPLTDIKVNLSTDVEAILGHVIETVTPYEEIVKGRDGCWYSLRVRPYRTMDHRIEGAVLMLVDVDELTRGQEGLRHYAELLEQTYEPIIVWDLETRAISYWNRAAEET